MELVLAAALKGSESGWEERLEQRTDPVAQFCALPHRVLLRSGQHAKCLHGGSVVGQLSVRGPIGAQYVGQHHGVEGVRLPARSPIPIAIPRDCERVDREYCTTGGSHAGHQQPGAGFNRDRQGFAVRVVLGQHSEQSAQSFGVIADPLGDQHHACLIDNRQVVMTLGPVDPARHRCHPSASALEADAGYGALMDSAPGTTSHEPLLPPPAAPELGQDSRSGTDEGSHPPALTTPESKPPRSKRARRAAGAATLESPGPRPMSSTGLTPAARCSRAPLSNSDLDGQGF